MMSSSVEPSEMLNFNVGLLGHVDSGKTSLAMAVSTTASTACFDKNPQSKERGITIDLGFSSFSVEIPEHLKKDAVGKSLLQYTLVDCPGHASLIKTIIGGAQIIDLMILVIDVTKGMQTQTAECLVIGEITCDYMIIVLNKCDLLPKSKCDTMKEKMTKKILKTLEKTKFADSKVVCIASKPGESEENRPEGIDELIKTLNEASYVPKRSSNGPFAFSVDHCFSIRGQGTVMTGTVLSGSIKIGENVEIPQLKVTKKVKSIQMFKKPVERIIQGDRAGICVTQFDPSTVERGIICTPGSLPIIYGVIVKVVKIPYYKGRCATKSKFHVSLGHETVMSKVSFFSSATASDFSFDEEYCYEDELAKSSDDAQVRHQYCLIEFERCVVSSPQDLLIGSKLDSDIHANLCRIAFKGSVRFRVMEKSYVETMLPRLKVFKLKSKEGTVERMVNQQEIICKNIIKKETNIESFIGLKVRLSTGEEGVIDGGFGQSGKVKIRIPQCLSESTTTILLEYAKKKQKSKESTTDGSKQTINVTLNFKRYMYDPKKKMIQS